MDQAVKVSPSSLGTYFFLDCERMLRYTATPQERKQEEGIPEPSPVESPLTEALLESGRRWEKEVIEKKLAGQVVFGPEREGSLFDRVLPYRNVLSILRNPGRIQYLYQPHLEPTAHFYRRYGIDPSQLTFSPCRPDLIRLQTKDDSVHLRITDIKASDTTKLSHGIQTTLYALILRDILESEEIPWCTVDLEASHIWLFEKEEPEEVAINQIIEPLELFLKGRLGEILLRPPQLAQWGLCGKCEWCPYLEHCLAEAENRQDLSLLPYFSKQAKKFLNALPKPVNSLTDLEELLQRPGAPELFRGCSHLSWRQEKLLSDVRALLGRTVNKKGKLRGGAAVAYGGVSTILPKGQHVGIVVTLQQDPLTGGIFAAGLHIHGGKEIHKMETPWAIVARRSDKEACDEVLEEFLKKLEQAMWAVHGYNVGEKDWKAQKTLQCYVYDTYEHKLLERLFCEALVKPELARRALSLFFYFQSPRLAEKTDYLSNEIPFPLIAITDVIRELVAMPVPVAYKLTASSIVLRPEKFASIYNEKRELSFPFSNRLRMDALLKAWAGGEAAEIDTAAGEVKSELERRLKACFSILAGVRERVGDGLFAFPPRFFLPDNGDLTHEAIARLAFMTRYEEALEYLGIRAARARSRSLRLESGEALRIELEAEIERGIWTAALAAESSHVIPDATGYSDWMLSADDPDGYREQMGFADFWYREQRWMPGKYRLAFAAIEDVSARGSRKFMRVKVIRGTNSPALAPGEFYLLNRRYVDYTSRRVLNSLKDIDRDGEHLFHELLSSPHAALRRRTRPKSVKRKADLAKFLAPFNFTESQREAFAAILDSSHRLIWGPPGTGKTHFLALTVLLLHHLWAGEGKHIKVLLTAFTHAAIENCLKMIVKLAQDYPQLARDDSIAITKLGEWRGNYKPQGIEERETWAATEESEVVGGTVFAIGKEGVLSPHFDMVIIDEGSQLKVAEAAIAVSKLAGKNGRLVIAGDDRQLGPILKGVYPEPGEGEAALFTSIFECLHGQDRNTRAYTSQLYECFRMNETLCRFPAQALYGERYRPAGEEIAHRRIGLMETRAPKSRPALKRKVRILDSTEKVRMLNPEENSPDDFVRWAVAPEYPLTLLVLEGVPALSENPAEAGIVADIATFLRENLLSAGEPYQSDEAFWQRGLFITSPHHAQIHAIYHELYRRRNWDYPPFVETVNKMQGQEIDCAIISYGVSDADYALDEGEFIYSLNRLNVAITRARAKTIVCLPAPLLTPPLSAFGRTEFVEGLNFMLHLRRFLEENGEKRKFVLPQTGDQAILSGSRIGDSPAATGSNA